jgi:predicted nucleotidyltransferase
MLSEETNQKIIHYLRKYDPVMIGIFGSYARGENLPDSDLDILVNLRSRFGLMEYVGMELDLTKLLGIKVDLVTVNALKNERLKKYIYNDLKIIFE